MDSYGRNWTADVMGRVTQSMFEMDEVIRLCLVALYTGGHVLLEANPGLGKTALVNSLSQALEMSFGRIQFTPDVMPSDITGTELPEPGDNGVSRLKFKPGPIFASLLLADEVNRATPKTQSAMLEAMAEKQVTVLGTTYPMPVPFMVLATQNPIDQEGTFNLPEAQLDRFMFKVLVRLPGPQGLVRIMQKSAQPPRQDAAQLRRETRSEAVDLYGRLKKSIMDVPPLPALQEHIANLVLVTEGRWDQLTGVEDQKPNLQRLQGLLTYGLGPRAAIALYLGTKGWAYLFDQVAQNADGPALARVAIHALRHRIKLDYGWEERYEPAAGRRTAPRAGILERYLRDLVVAAAPRGVYRQSVQAELAKVLAEQGWQ